MIEFQVTERGAGGAEEVVGVGVDAEAAEFFDVATRAGGGVVGEEGAAEAERLDLGEETEGEGEKLLSQIERAIQIQGEMLDVPEFLHRTGVCVC